MEVLLDFVKEGRGLNRKPQQQHCSYREALVASLKPAQPSDNGGGSSAKEVPRGASASLGNGQGYSNPRTIWTGTVQRKGGCGRSAVGLAEGNVLSMLLDVNTM